MSYLVALKIQSPDIKVLPKDLSFKNETIKFQILVGDTSTLVPVMLVGSSFVDWIEEWEFVISWVGRSTNRVDFRQKKLLLPLLTSCIFMYFYVF